MNVWVITSLISNGIVGALLVRISSLKSENRRLRQEIAALEAFDYSQTDRAHALRSVLDDDDPDVRRIY
jgi:hypothetical protein